MGKVIWWLVAGLLLAGAFSPLVKIAIFMLALGFAVVAEKCLNELENKSHWR